MMKTIFYGFAVALGAGLSLSLLALFLSVFVVALVALRARWIPVIYNVRSLAQRSTTTLLTVVGMALVVFVFSTVLMLLQGIRGTLASAGRADNVVVLRKGATADITSSVRRDQLKLLASSGEVAVDPGDGKPLLDAQLSTLIYAIRPGGDDSNGTNVLVRGVSGKALTLHDKLRLSEGRWLRPGTSEIVVGKAILGKFVGAELGKEMPFARRGWTVVGVVDGGGSSFDSEIWMDLEQGMEAFQRDTYSTVTMRVKDASAIAALAARVGADPRLSLDVKQELRYFEDLSNGMRLFLGFLGIFVALVFSLGATLGAMISMYGQVSARTREIGTLRALGFRRASVLVSFVLESLLLGLLSGAIGVAASSLMELASFSTVNFATFSEVTFRFTLTPAVIAMSLGFAVLMGYAGGLLPALSASRTSIIEATRA